MPRPELATTDDVLLAGRRWLTEPAPRAAVVLVHGFTSSADDPQLETVAEALHTAGFDVVSYDARGHGRSGGESTLGDLERHDVAAAVATARERSDIVVLVGASMGAIAALRYAAVDAGLAGVIALSCPSHWRLPRTPVGLLMTGLTRTPLGRAAAARWLRVRIAPEWKNPKPPAALIGQVSAPTVVIHGTRDRFIPATDAEELAARACDPCRLDVVDGMGHAFDDRAVPVIRDAVEWSLDLVPEPVAV